MLIALALLPESRRTALVRARTGTRASAFGRVTRIPVRRLSSAGIAPALAALALVAAALGASAALGRPAASLALWGAVGGVLGAIALEAGGAVGVRLGVFPMALPAMLGMIASGLWPRFERNLLARSVELAAAQPRVAHRSLLAPQIRALVGLSEPRRAAAVTGLLGGVARLPADRAPAVLATQLGLVAELAEPDRQRVLGTMERALRQPERHAAIGQRPMGMPRFEMREFRGLASTEVPRTLGEVGLTTRELLIRGYLWYFLIGAALGMLYVLLVGSGSWAHAAVWGALVWLARIAAGPVLVPLVRLPAWSPVGTFVTQLAFSAPLAFVALSFVGEQASAASLLGVVTR